MLKYDRQKQISRGIDLLTFEIRLINQDIYFFSPDETNSFHRAIIYLEKKKEKSRENKNYFDRAMKLLLLRLTYYIYWNL